jgi:hypothetical protein
MQTAIRVLLCALLALSVACATATSPSKSATKTPPPGEAAARALGAAQKSIAGNPGRAACSQRRRVQASCRLGARALLGMRAYVYTLQKSYPRRST